MKINKKRLNVCIDSRRQTQSGQALLVVILVMVVALTVGLSVAVRSMTNLRISSEDDNSQRAFSAAEAGIERALVNSSNIPLTNLANNTSYSTTLTPLSGLGFAVHNGTTVLKDEPVDVWLSDYSTNPVLKYENGWSGNFTVNWGKSGEACTTSESTNTQAALEIVLISGPKASPKLTEYLLDPCNIGRAGGNKFQTIPAVQPGNAFDGKTYAYKYTITVPAAAPNGPGIIARIIPLYAPTVIGVQGSVALPAQGTTISSTGISDTTQRKIVSFRGYPKLPVEIFPFIYFSPK